MNETETIKMFGAVGGIAQLAATRATSQNSAEIMMSGYLGDLMFRAAEEAEGEVKKLQAVVERMKTLSRGIKNSPKISLGDPRVKEMMSIAKAFDGWTVSLLETDYTVIGLLEGMMMYQARSATLMSGLQAIWSTRFNSGSYFKDAKANLVF